MLTLAPPDQLPSGTALGIGVAYGIFTDGDAGGSDRAISRADVQALRRDEQVAAAAEASVTEVRFLGYPNGRLVVSMDAATSVVRSAGSDRSVWCVPHPIASGPQRQRPRPSGGRRGLRVRRLPRRSQPFLAS